MSSDQKSIFSKLETAASNWPDRAALIHRDEIYSYHELFARANEFAVKLRAAGVAGDDLVGLVSSRDAEFVVALLGLMAINCPLLILSPALRSNEVARITAQMRLDKICYPRNLAAIFAEVSSGDAITSLPIGRPRRDFEILSCRQHDVSESKRHALARLQIKYIRLSSGTSGVAKGIMLSEQALWARAMANIEMHSVETGDGILYLLSLDLVLPHWLAYFSNGAKIVIEESHRLDLIKEATKIHSISHIHATPFFYQMMVSDEGTDEPWLSSVRFLISTGAPLPATVAEQFREKFGREIGQYYGLGECGPVFVNVSEDASKQGSAGLLLPGWETKYLNGVHADGQRNGELLVRGPGLFSGYYEPWCLADEIMENGWFKTGDIVRREEDGFHWIVGRTKDIINIAGSKVFPWEIEEILLSHPAVAEAVVYAATNARFGEVPHAKVKIREDGACSARDLMRFANARLPVFKSLRNVEIISELEKTTTGKIKRWG